MARPEQWISQFRRLFRRYLVDTQSNNWDMCLDATELRGYSCFLVCSENSIDYIRESSIITISCKTEIGYVRTSDRSQAPRMRHADTVR